MTVAHGGLIRVHREKEFVNKTTGEYIDDDIDLRATPETIVHAGQIEEQLFHEFGWSMRVFVNGNDDAEKFVVFAQIFSLCGHKIITRPGKIKTGLEPAIELYPIVIVRGNGESGPRVVKGLWQSDYFAPESLILPSKQVDFESIGSKKTMQLQLPNKEFHILECLYGNWTVPSNKHAGYLTRCDAMSLEVKILHC